MMFKKLMKYSRRQHYSDEQFNRSQYVRFILVEIHFGEKKKN